MDNPASTPLALAAGLAAAGATLLGGGLAFTLDRRPFLVLISCAAVVGVALFDLLPQALALAPADARAAVALAAALGVLAYLVGGRALARAGRPGQRGHLAGAGLTAHSLADGAGIGLASHVSVPVTAAAVAAVIAHDLLDGVNTFTLCREGGLSVGAARRWLVADAAAPVAGVIAALAIHVGRLPLALMLAVFAGGLLQIGGGLLAGRLARRAG